MRIELDYRKLRKVPTKLKRSLGQKYLQYTSFKQKARHRTLAKGEGGIFLKKTKKHMIIDVYESSKACPLLPCILCKFYIFF